MKIENLERAKILGKKLESFNDFREILAGGGLFFLRKPLCQVQARGCAKMK